MKLEDIIIIDENINLDNYLEFKKIVKENMKHPEWLGDFSKDDLISMQKTGTKIWIFYNDNDPVCSMMAIPSTKKDMDSFEINLDCKDVIDYGPMFVMPKYVGNKLQYQMLKMLDKYSIEKGYKYAASTVHPDNIFSINNLLKDGFEKTDQKEFERGIRNIYVKEFSREEK